MDIKSLFTKYGAFARVRVSKNQKIRFLTTLLAEFRELGFKQGDMYKMDYKKKLSVIGTVGDILHSDYLCVTYYDTPVKNFVRTEYLPFDQEQLKVRTRWNYLIPMFLISIFFLIYTVKILVPTLQKGIKDIPGIIALVIVFLVMMILVKISQYGGIPSRDVFKTNTSSVITLINLAENLTAEQRKKVSFAFVDFGTMNYIGYHVLKEILGNKKCKIIFLDNISEGDLVLVEKKNSWLDNRFNNPMYIYSRSMNTVNNQNVIKGIEDATRNLLKLIN